MKIQEYIKELVPEKWYWFGALDPQWYGRQSITFSVGIFKLTESVSYRKRATAAVFRVSGYASNPQSVYREAQRICDELNKQQAELYNAKTIVKTINGRKFAE